MGVNVDKFGDSFKVGEKVENEVLKILRKKYPQAKRIYGYNAGYDIEVPEVAMLVEVKFDEKSYYTGNFFFETQLQSPDEEEPHQSGVNVTICNYWVHVDKDYYHFIEFETLMYIIRELERDGIVREIKSKGIDGTVSYGYLVPKGKIQHSPFVTMIKRG